MISNDTNTKQPDFIGDIHGHFNALELLLKKMGYEKKNGVYNHPDRFPVFLGDYIDRGPNIKEVLHLVRSMQENGSAIALMGNHEFNYLCYHIRDENDQPFRQNSSKNEKQIRETNEVLKDISERESYLDWMASLPIILETNNYRAVHAQWKNSSVEQIKNSGIQKFNRDGLLKLYSNNNLKENLNILLKGLEIKLPEKLQYKDNEGHERKESRLKWWNSSSGKKFGDVFASLPEEIMEKDISEFHFDFSDFYNSSDKPVFFGHYWLKPREFGLTSSNTCCLDFSIVKGGFLASYRFSGESQLNHNNLVKHID